MLVLLLIVSAITLGLSVYTALNFKSFTDRLVDCCKLFEEKKTCDRSPLTLSCDENATFTATTITLPPSEAEKIEAAVKGIVDKELEYRGVGRRILKTDEVESQEEARYERDPASIGYVISRRGAVPEQVVEGEEIVVPLFDIASHPSTRNVRWNRNPKKAAEMWGKRAGLAIRKEEDSMVLKAMIAAAEVRKDQVIRVRENWLSRDDFLEAFSKIEQHDLIVTHVVVSSKNLKLLRAVLSGDFDEATGRERRTTGLAGHVWTADVYATSRLNHDKILFVCREEAGYVPTQKGGCKVEFINDSQKLRKSAVISESLGVCISSDWAISMIELTPDPEHVITTDGEAEDGTDDENTTFDHKPIEQNG